MGKVYLSWPDLCVENSSLPWEIITTGLTFTNLSQIYISFIVSKGPKSKNSHINVNGAGGYTSERKHKTKYS